MTIELTWLGADAFYFFIFFLQSLHIFKLFFFLPPAEKGRPPIDKNNHSHVNISPSVEELPSDLRSPTSAEYHSMLKTHKRF